MAEGRSNAGIAHQLWAEGTVEKHVRSILTKLQIREQTTTIGGSSRY